jgi:hypothetical protein
MESDLDDVRFCDIDGNYLPYWIESLSTSATIWTIKPMNATRIFMRYGNSGAIGESGYI